MENIKIHLLTNKKTFVNYDYNGLNILETIRSKSNPNEIYILDDDILTAIIIQSNGDIQKKWDANLEIEPINKLKHDRVSIVNNYVFVNNFNGIKIYRIDSSGLQLHADYTEFKTNHFKSLSSPQLERNFIFGRFSTVGILGIIYQDAGNKYDDKNGINIFEIDKSEINDPNAYPIYDLGADANNPSIYENIRARGINKDISVGTVKSDSDELESFIIRDNDGLKLYRINADSEIELLHTLTGIMGPIEDRGDNEIILFADVTGRKNSFRDVILRNKNGLYLYEYDSAGYKLINHNPMFSNERGWNDPIYLKTLKTYDTTGDGKDDLIFTGPQGLEILSYDIIENVWNTLLETNNLTVDERHARVLDVIKTDKIQLLTQNTNGEINNWTLDASPPSTLPKIEKESSDKKSPREDYPIPTHGLEALPSQQELRLRDMIDYSFMKNNVDTVTGKSKFTIPLMNSILKYLNWFSISYDGTSDTSTVLGRGWSMPEQQIVLNDQGSVFPEDHRYYLATTSNILELYYVKSESHTDARNETQTKMYFTLVGTDLIDKNSDEIISNIVYDVEPKKWTVNSNGNKYIYGTEAGTGYDVKWENWRKRGRSTDSQIQVPKIWNLVEIFDSNDQKVAVYNYDRVEVIADPKTENTFTKGMYLKSVTAPTEEGEDPDWSIEFEYRDKPDNEIEKIDIDDGNLNTFTAHTRYLTGYTVSTDEYTQTIEFYYDARNNRRDLIRISQKEEELIPVLEFKYGPTTGTLIEINSPENMKAKMTIQSFKKRNTLTQTGPVRVEQIDLQSNIYHHTDYMILTYIKQSSNEADNHKIVLKVFSPDAKTELIQASSFGMNNVNEYRVSVTDNLFYILLISRKNEKRELWVFHKKEDNKTWDPTPSSYILGERALVRGGRDFVVYTDVTLPSSDKKCYERIVLPPSGRKPDPPQHSLVLLEYKKGKLNKTVLIDSNNLKKDRMLSQAEMAQDGFTIRGKLYPAEITEELLLSSTADMFVHYADPFIVLNYRDQFGNWEHRPIADMGKQYRRTLDTFMKFDLNCERKKFLMMLYKETALQMNDNIIISYRLMLDDKSDLYTNTRIVLLGSDHRFRRREVFNQIKDHIESFSVRQNILEYTYKYDNKTEQFKIDVDMPEKKEKTQDDYDILKEVQEQMNHGFLLNIREYLATIESGKYTQNSTIIEFNGAEWEKLPDDAQTIKYPVVQKLTDMYKLEQHQPDGKIILREIGNEGRHDVNLDITNLGMIVQSLPNYIAYKSDRYGLQFQRFDIKGGISSPAETLPGETLSPHCNSNLIITFGRERNNGKDSGRSIIFRYIEPDIDTEVITTHTLYMNNGMKRKTAFQYFDEQISGSNVFFPKVFIKPGVNIEKFGYIEQITDFENKNLSYVNIRDARNQIVKHEKSSQQNQNNNEEFNKNISDTTLFDKEKEAEIVQFFPFYQSDDEVDYYGFESYESKNPAKIVFDSENLQMYQFPLTGVVFLQLSGENKFTSVYTPKNQENVYKASSWIRKPNIGFKVGTLSPNFKANIYSGQNYICTVLSKVKSRLEDWFLLEALIDMTYLKEFDTQSKSLRPNIVITNEKSSARTPISNSELRIELSISATNADEIVDVDHILFAPINLKSIVNVYNSKLWTLTAQITTTGLIKKFLYDSYNNDLAVVNEYNQVTEINAFTKLTTQVLNGNRFLETSEVTVTGKRGIYETFSEYAYKKRWEIENTEAWSLFTNIIHHIDRETSDKIHLRADFKEDSICIRFDYNLEKETSKLIINNDIVLEGDYITYDRERIRILPRGELIYILEKDRAFVFVDGLLYFDNKQTQAKGIVLELGGFTSIGKVIILEDPLVSITYTTPLDDELQKIQLIGHDRAIVRSYEIDEIGRKIKETLPQTIHMNPNQPLLRYNRNITPDHVKYRRIVYQPNSLNQIQIMDIPNSEFTEEKGTGRMFLQYDQQNIPPYILNTYPIIKGYSYQVEMKGGEVRDCNVYNNKRQKIAQYLYVPGVNGILSSYEYNEKDELQTTFTPAYHKLAETTWRSSVSPTKLETLKKNLAFHFSYTETGKPKIYQGPDSGKRLSIYNKQDLLKFFVNYQYKDENRITSVTYFNYDEINRLVSTGYINNTEKLTVEYIEKLTETYLSKDVNPNIVEYQKFEYDDLEEDPFLRENVKRVVTLTKDYPFAEEIVTNMRKHVLTRRIYLPLQNNKDLQSIEMTKQYTESGDLVDRINYPYENNGNILKIQLRYNKQNQIVGISGPDGDLCNFEYNAEGGVSKEIRSPKKSTQFERTYKYNELGGFTQISDKFLDENLTYTQPGYGNFGFGDGTMTSTTYNVKWHKSADESALKLNEQSFGKELGLENSKKCFNALKQTGYINSENYQEKIFYEPDSQIPAVCYENRNKISKAINQNTFPKYYGHSYDFGNQNELTKAKYFVGKNNVKPLQVRVLESLYKDNARDIWNKLKAFNFILEDNLQIQLKTAQAKKGSETLANPDIENDIRNAVNTLDPTFAVKYGKSIQQLLLQSYLDGKLLSIDDFKKFIDYKKNTNAINTVWNVIQSKYLNDPTNPKLRQVFDANTFQAAIRLLNEHFTTEILEDEGDTETGLLDEHGNHKTFYVGSNVHHLEYEENSNRVKTVYMSEGTKQYSYAMEHDSQGNVIKAGHKNIEHIEYDKVISKISQIRMTNGQVIKFNYDSRTDRIAKRVFESNGKLTKEINYIRDENGKCLVQREVVYIENSTPMVTMTAYVYHPKGLLLGFYRNGEFYHVLTDHEGSTRLIEKNGEIVAAYDYYPYGSAIRVFGKDPNAHIPYRYTGQEWDEETGLYYFIARYYDPEIGRFLQMDPMGQYFSPYKFSGNSPVSLVDPDGEFVFLLVVVVFLVVGAYLGGAAVNGNWNPLEWEWSSKETWLGIIGGGIVGATIPFFAMQSVAILAAHMPLWAAWTTVAALGVGFAYAEGVKYTHNWNPFEWDYTNPSLINTIFTGFGQGTGFVYSVSGVTSPVAFFKGLSNFKKIAFVATTVGNFGLNTYIEGSAMKWNFKDPQMYIMLLTNAVHAHEGAMMFSKGVGRIGKRFTSLKTHLKSLRTGTKKIGDYLNKDVGKKLLQYTGEVLSGLEVTASKAYDTMNAVDNDEVLWNLAGSRAYSYHVQEFINDEKVARRKWQAALFFVPGSHMKKVTGFKQLPTRQLVSNLVTLFNNAKLGQTLSTGLHPIDKFYGAIDLDSSFASKLIPALGDLNNLEMVLFSNSDTGTHIVTFMDKRSSGSRLQISDVDDQEFNVNILSTIDDKLNAIRQECLRIFRDIAPQLRNDIKVTGFVNDNSLIDVLIQKIERKINANKPFVNSLNIGLKKILTTQTRRLNTKILSLRDAVRRNEANEEQKRSLQKLTKQRIEMGSLNERLNKIIDNHSPKLLGIEKILANWIPEKGIENKTIIYVETMLPVDYRQTDFIYDEGVCATSSRPIKECNWCPETISKNAHSSLNHLRWTAEIDVGSVDVNQGLFFEPTNEWKQSSSRSKRSEKSWIVSKLQTCLEYLNLTSAAHDSPIWNNRPQLEQNVPLHSDTQFTKPDYSMADVNSTLLLLDMCVRKVTGEKYIDSGNQISMIKAQEMSINITEDIEQLLLETINEELLDLIDFPYLQCRLFEAIVRGMPSKIPTIVMNSLKDVLKELTFKERQNIENYFNKKCN